ncbi:hypothetical protein EDB19DRAFT_1705587 [Suillus lakei]|nr:hypothetical protein EDB19DRAFT_1705587 [Suillus lakei]
MSTQPRRRASSFIVVHGWPSFWSFWGRGVSDRRVQTSRTSIVRSSSTTLSDITSDLICVLEHVGIKPAICIGHDWGADVCYEAPRGLPDFFYALVTAGALGSLYPAGH